MQKCAQPSLLCGHEGCGNVAHPSVRYCFECREKVLGRALERFPAPPDGKVWIYFIRSGEGGPIKIGQAKDPVDRLMGLQTGSADELTLETAMIGEPKVERQLHKRFAKHRIRGEWFKPAAALQCLIVSARKFEKAARAKRFKMMLGTDVFDEK